jgi:hypothetical protein
MIRRSARVLLLGLIAATTACADPPTPVTPTVPTTIEEPAWTGTLTINGGQTLPFNVLASGQISVTIFALSPNVDNTVRVGLALGLWSGQACTALITNDNAFQTTVLYGTATVGGAFCARIYDATGKLTEPVDFDIRVTHP